MRPQIVHAAVWLVLSGTPLAQAQTATSPLTLDAAIARAMTANPRIVAARLQRPVATAGVGVARERPNPEIAYEAERETPKQAMAGSLPIELGGKRQRRIELAEAGVLSSDAELALVVADVRNDVRRAYYELVGAGQRVAVATDLRGLALRARDAAQARFSAGAVPRQDVLQTELALFTADNEVAAASGDVAAARAELNALLGQPAAAPLEVIDDLSAGPLPSLEDVLTQASKANTQLGVLDRRIGEQMARRALANAMRTPDLTAGSSFTYDALPEFHYGWRLSFSVALPVFTQHRAAVQVEDAELARLRAERDATAAQVAGSVTAALARASAARDQVARYQTEILPRAVEVERMAQDGYTAGQTPLPALITALQQTRDTRRLGLQAALEYQRALADLERAVGTALR